MNKSSMRWYHLPPDTSEHIPPNPSQTGWYLICLPHSDGSLSWHRWLVIYRDGLPAHRWSPIRVLTQHCTAMNSLPVDHWRPNHYTTKPFPAPAAAPAVAVAAARTVIVVVGIRGHVQCFYLEVDHVLLTSHLTEFYYIIKVSSQPASSDPWRSAFISCDLTPMTFCLRWPSGRTAGLEVAQTSCWPQPVILPAITALVRLSLSKFYLSTHKIHVLTSLLFVPSVILIIYVFFSDLTTIYK